MESNLHFNVNNQQEICVEESWLQWEHSQAIILELKFSVPVPFNVRCRIKLFISETSSRPSRLDASDLHRRSPNGSKHSFICSFVICDEWLFGFAAVSSSLDVTQGDYSRSFISRTNR